MLGEEESEFFGGEGYWGQNSYGEDDANDQGSYMMGYYDEEDDEDVEEEEEYSAQYASYEDDEKSQETPKIISLATGLSDESDEQSADEREQFFKSNEDEEDWANIDLHAHSPLREYLTDHFPDAAFPESDDDEDSISRILRGGHPRERNSGDESDLVNNGSDGSFHYDHNDDGEDDEDDEEIDYQHQRNPLIPQQQRNISKSKKSLNPRKAPPRDRKRGVKNPPKSNGLKEVERKHKVSIPAPS